MDFAQIIRQVEEEILRLEQIKSLLREDPFDAGTVRSGKELNLAEPVRSAAEEWTPPHS